jgi:hypothetical protein
MKNKNKIAMLVIAALCLAVFAGCDSDSDGMALRERYPSDEMADAPGAGAERDESVLRSFSNVAGNTDSDGSDSDGTDEVAGSQIDAVQRRIIRNANLRVETVERSAAELYADFVAQAVLLGGHEFSSVTNQESHTQNSRGRITSRVTAILRVPPENLDAFLAYINENSRVLTSSIDSEDVTAEFYDLTTRLATKRSTLTAYFTLLENAESLEDILRIQRMIDQITEEIEAMQGRLNVLNNRVNMATVRLDVSHVTEFTVEEEPEERREVDWSALSISDMGWLIRNGFVSVVNTLATVLQWLIIIIAVTAPLWIPVVAIVWVLTKRSRKKRAKVLAEIERRGAEYRERRELEESQKQQQIDTNTSDITESSDSKGEKGDEESEQQVHGGGDSGGD